MMLWVDWSECFGTADRSANVGVVTGAWLQSQVRPEGKALPGSPGVHDPFHVSQGLLSPFRPS